MNKRVKDKIAISGATGFVGRNLTKYFDRHNTKYTSITRTSFKTEHTQILSKCFCFIHLIGTGSENSETSFQEVNVELTKKAIDICKKSKIKKIIYFSGLGVSKDSTSKYFISKFESEQIIINSGLDYTIFRPSYIIGKDDFLTKNIQKQIKEKKVCVPGTGEYIIQPISINDVCMVIHLALKSKFFSKKIIDLVGPEKITFRQFLKNSISNSNVRMEEISEKKASHKALTDKKFPYGTEDLNILFGNFQGDHQKLSKISGIKFTKIRSI